MNSLCQISVFLYLRENCFATIFFSLSVLVVSGCAGAIVVGATAGLKKAENQNQEEKNIAKPRKIQKELEFNKEESSITKTVSVPVKKPKKLKFANIKNPSKLKPVFPRFHSLMDLDSVNLKNILGKPEFVRRDGIAEIWIYNSKSCKIYFFLYEKPYTKNLKVTHVETQLTHKNQISNDTCVKKIITKKQLVQSPKG